MITDVDTVRKDAGDVQQLRKELESYKSLYGELQENNESLSEQLSILQEENSSLKEKISITEQRFENQISQIMRLNDEISKSMQEKEQLESDAAFFKNLYESMTSTSLPPTVAEEMRKKVEDVALHFSLYV